MTHEVAFSARVEPWGPSSPPRAALVATCACGWSHAFVPVLGRESVILEVGLSHVARSLADEAARSSSPCTCTGS